MILLTSADTSGGADSIGSSPINMTLIPEYCFSSRDQWSDRFCFDFILTNYTGEKISLKDTCSPGSIQEGNTYHALQITEVQGQFK